MGNTYSAYRQNLHVTFQDELQDIEKGFHDNVKSAECTCDLGNFCILVSTVPSTSYIICTNKDWSNFIIHYLDPRNDPLIQNPTNCIKLFAEAEPMPGFPDLNYEVSDYAGFKHN